MTKPPVVSSAATPPGFAAKAAAVVINLLVLDAALETFRAGVPVRWWVVGVVAVYAAGVIAWWRLRQTLAPRLTPAALATAGALVIAALLVTTAWTDVGATEGIRLLGLSTSILLSVISLCAVAMAGFTLWSEHRLPVAARWTLLALSAYGIAAFLIAIWQGTSFIAQMHGSSPWERLPFWLQGAFVGGVVIIPLAILAQALRIFDQMRQQQPLRGQIHKATAMTTVFAMVLAAVSVPGGVPISVAVMGSAAADGNPAASARLGTPERFDQILRVVEAAERQIPRDTFDPTAIVQGVGSDPARIFEWVRDNTYWIPYRGALRGHVGVLMDRLGNSLDRSILLAELLRVGGHTVRLAHGELPPQRAEELFRQVRPMPPSPMPRQDQESQDSSAADLERYANDLQLDAETLRANLKKLTVEADQLSSELARRVGVQAPFLIEAVTTTAAIPQAAGRNLAAMADHWWVQRLEGVAWVDLDPLLPDAQPGNAHIQAGQTFGFDKPIGEIPVPREYAQEIGIRVVVEQWKEGRLTEMTALEHAFRPAEVFGQPIVLQNTPLDQPEPSKISREKDPRSALKSMVLGQTEWLPELAIGDLTIRQSSFTAGGELNDRRAGKAGLSQGPGAGALAGGFDALGGGAEPSAPEGKGYLTAQWVEYQIRVPGEPVRTLRRDVFDLLDQQPRNGQPLVDPAFGPEKTAARALNLLNTIQVLPVVCRLSPQYVMERTLTEILGNAKAVAAISASVTARDLDGIITQAKKMKPATDRLLSLALARFAWSRSAQDVYLDAPNILSSRTVMTTDSGGALQVRHGFDIVANDVAVRRGVRTPFQVRLTQGAADTNAEALLVGAGRVVNAGTIMNAGTPTRNDWVTLRGSDDAAWSNENWPAETRARMRRAVAAGFVVVAPLKASGTVGAFEWAWWQIDPRTGAALGIGQHGWGQAGVEKTLLDVLLPAQLAFQLFFAWAFLYCLANDSASTNEAWVINSDNFGRCACAGLAAGAAAGAFVAAPAVGVGLAMVAAAVYKEAVCA